MNNTTQVLGTITENHTGEVAEVFGKEIAAKLENCEGKTFLQILMENGRFDLTNSNQ